MPMSETPLPSVDNHLATIMKSEHHHTKHNDYHKHHHPHTMESKNEDMTIQVKVAILTVSDTVASGAGPDRRLVSFLFGKLTNALKFVWAFTQYLDIIIFLLFLSFKPSTNGFYKNVLLDMNCSYFSLIPFSFVVYFWWRDEALNFVIYIYFYSLMPSSAVTGLGVHPDLLQLFIQLGMSSMYLFAFNVR